MGFVVTRIKTWERELTAVREKIAKAMIRKEVLKALAEDLERRRDEKLHYLQQKGLL